MDSDLLLTHLLNTLSPDNTSRKSSEAFLLSQNASILSQILSLLLSDIQISPELQLVGMTLIKNRISSDFLTSSTDDITKETVKNQIIEFIVKIQDPFTGYNNVLIRMCLKIIDIILLDTKSQFQVELLEFANNIIKDENKTIEKFYIGILLVCQVSRRNRHTNNFELIDNISSNFCPIYLEFLKSYTDEIRNDSSDKNKMLIIYKILKTLNYIMTTRITKYFQDLSSNILLEICKVLCDLFYLSITKIHDTLIGKWILRFIIKLQLRSIQMDDSLYSSEFIQLMTSTILQYNISNILEYFSKSNDFVVKLVELREDPDRSRTLYYFLTYLTKCLSPSTYSHIENHMNLIISNVIVPTLSINNEEIDSFEFDPIEFVNSNLTSTLFFSNSQILPSVDISNADVKSSSYSFIIKLVKLKPEISSPLISLSGQILSSNDKSAVTCSLNILKLIQFNTDQETLQSAIDRIIQINSELSNADSLWLRCLIYEFLSDLNNTNKYINLDPVSLNLPIALDLNQPIPLLISTLKLMILKCDSNNINPIQIMQILLTLNESHNLEILSELIDLLVEKYSQELGPYNSQLVSSLCSAFLRTIEGTDIDDDGGESDVNGSKENKLIGLVSNIITIIMSSKDKESVMSMNENSSAIISTVLENGVLDLVESIMELVEEINISCKQVLNLQVIINSFKNYGFDYFDYYEAYFQTVYCFGNLQQRTALTEALGWLLSENPSGFEGDDLEFIDFMSSLSSEMVVSCIPNENDDGISDRVYQNIIEMRYNAFEDKEEFWDNKITFRCIIGGFLRKPMIVMNIFGDKVEEVLLRFENLIKNGIWSTVYDLKLGMMGLLEIVKASSDNEHIRSLSLNIISLMCERYSGALDHRNNLLKITVGDEAVENDMDVELDDEFDELSKISVLDNVDIFSDLKALLG